MRLLRLHIRAAARAVVVTACALLVPAAPAQTAAATPDSMPEQSGRLKPAGEYLGRQQGSTVSVLPDGSVLVYGYGYEVDDRLDQAEQTRRLRQRRGNVGSAPDPDPKLWDPLKRGWRRLPNPPECTSSSRHLHTATVLPDGTVLIAGGLCDQPKLLDDRAPQASHAALSLWDARTRRWQAAPSLQQPRIHHSASLLPDGSVLIVGGEADPGLSQAGDAVLASVERFAAGRVATLPPLAVPRARHTATVLADGSVLVVGGFDESGSAIAAAELWNPDTRSWRPLPTPRVARHSHSATRLADGRVLIAGGKGRDGRLLSSVEIWDPARGAWSAGPELPIPLLGHSAAVLASGQVLVAGGAWIASYAAPIPWAWTWTPGEGEWQVAGHTTPPNEVSMSSGIALAPRPDGGAMVFTVPDIMRWEPLAKDAGSAPPMWQAKPSAAVLAEGRVMLVGREAGDVGTGKPIARVWDAGTGTWANAGSLSARSWMHEDTLQLPSGRVIHVGIDADKTLVCEAWQAADNAWQSCGSRPLEYVSPSTVQLGLLPDGRAFAIANTHETLVLDEAKAIWTAWRAEWSTQGMAYGAPIRAERPLARVFDEVARQWIDINDAAARFRSRLPGAQDALLWDGKGGLWAYVFVDRKMGRNAQFLPDGCALSTGPLAVFDPRSGRATPLVDPGIGLKPGASDMVILRDGTVVIAGVSAGAKDPGAGFFHRKASCAGFDRQGSDDAYIAGGLVRDEPVAAASTAQAPAAPRPTWRERTGRMLKERGWLLLACLGPLLGYLLLRRTRLNRVQAGPAWVLRLIVYGLVLVFVVPAIWSYLRFDRAIASRACEDDSKACLEAGSGLLKPVKATLERRQDASAIPCRMVGVWSSRQGSQMYRIELKGDGTYFMEAGELGIGNRNGYTGHWAVQGQQMVWRHDQGGGGLDVNPIEPESDTRFTLVEGNGKRTRYELIRAVPSKKCTP